MKEETRRHKRRVKEALCFLTNCGVRIERGGSKGFIQREKKGGKGKSISTAELLTLAHRNGWDGGSL